MKVAISKLGSAGLPTVHCLAQGGHTRFKFDVSEIKVRHFRAGVSQIPTLGNVELHLLRLTDGRATVCAGIDNSPDQAESCGHDLIIATAIAKRLMLPAEVRTGELNSLAWEA